MCQSDYLSFLIATQSDPNLMADLRRASAWLLTLEDLVAFGARHGFRFDATDIPVDLPCEPHRANRSAPPRPAP